MTKADVPGGGVLAASVPVPGDCVFGAYVLVGCVPDI